MEKALAEEGIELVHIIGPKTAHAIHPQSKIEVDRRLKSLAKSGRDAQPIDLEFATYTLRYNKLHWLTVDGLAEHWTQARVAAGLASDGVEIDAEGVTDLTLTFRRRRIAVRRAMPTSRSSSTTTKSKPPVPRATNPGKSRSTAPAANGSSAGVPVKILTARCSAKRTACKARSTTPSSTRFIFVRPTGKAWHETSRQVGHGRAGPRHRALAAALPRRRAGEGRHGHHRRRHRSRRTSILWGDPQQQRGPRARSPTSCRSAWDATSSSSSGRGERRHVRTQRQARPDR